MGAHHSNNKSLPPFQYEKKFPYDTKCPIEDEPDTISEDLSFFGVSIPCAGNACPDIELLKSSWISGCPNPEIPAYQTKSYSVFNLDDDKYSLPRFYPSGQYSLIRLSSKFTKNDLVNTTQVEAQLGRVYSLLQDEIDPGTFPSFLAVSFGSARFSSNYQRLHVLICRLIYHQIMSKNKMLYYGSPESIFLTHEGVEYALIQHPVLLSSLFTFNKKNLFPFYPLPFLRSLKMVSYEFFLLPLKLIRSSFAFHHHPAQDLLKLGKDNLFPGSTKFTMPFSLLYLDCLSDKSIHTLYSFILHHIFACNTGSTVYNPDAPIIVVLVNSTLLDRGILINEFVVLDAFEKYLTITPQIYVAPPCPSQQAGRYTFYRSSVIHFPETHYFDTPCDVASIIPTAEKSNILNVAFSNEDFMRSCNHLLKVLNDALFQAIIPLFLKMLVSPKPANLESQWHQSLAYVNSIPLCNPSKFRSFLPLAQTEYPALIQNFQWHNLQKSGVQVIQFSMFTYCTNNYFMLRHGNGFSSKSLDRYKVPFIKTMCSVDISRRDVTVSAEYLVDVQNSLEYPVDSYNPIQPITNDISDIVNTIPLQKSFFHAKMFAPLESQVEETQISEQTILAQLDEEYRYSLTSAPVTHIVTSTGTAPGASNSNKKENSYTPSSNSSNSSNSYTDSDGDTDNTTDKNIQIDNADQIDGGHHSSDINNNCITHSIQNSDNDSSIDPTVFVESRNKPQRYTFNYRGEHCSIFNTPYTANIDYFISSQNKDIEIQITSPDFHQPPTQGDRRISLPIPFPADVSAAHCTLPMNQILAIDAHLCKMAPQIKKQSRYLVQLTSTFFPKIDSNIIPHFHPYICPAICAMSLYDDASPFFSSYDTKNLDPFHETMSKFNMNIPLIFVFVLPEDFDIKYDRLPRISIHSKPLYGWEFDCKSYIDKHIQNDEETKNNEKENKKPHSQADIQYHCNMILQRMKHIAKYLTEPPTTISLPPTRRTVYYFAVKGVAGYFECLPRINQCALAHFFSFGMQTQ